MAASENFILPELPLFLEDPDDESKTSFAKAIPVSIQTNQATNLACKHRRMKRPRFSKKRDYKKEREAKLITPPPPVIVKVPLPVSHKKEFPPRQNLAAKPSPPIARKNAKMETWMGISFECMTIDWYSMEVGLHTFVSSENMKGYGSKIYSKIDLEKHLEEHKMFHRQDSGTVSVSQLDTFFNDLPPYVCF
jgi:hypothetical protein